MKAFYSVIQYSPDRSRAEAANVGLVLFTEGPSPRLAVKVSETLGRVVRFFKPSPERLARVGDAARATATRLTLSAEDLTTLGDLELFTRTMGNEIRMTPPRPVVVTDIEHDIVRLYDELVGDAQSTRTRRAVVLPTPINRVFEELASSQKVFQLGRIKVPVINQTIDVPYAYRNGVLNLVKPAIFTDDTHADAKAAKLALQGDQLRKHPEVTLAGKVDRRLVVVSAAASESKVEQEVAPIFAEYGVVYVPTSRADEFARKVKSEAK